MAFACHQQVAERRQRNHDKHDRAAQRRQIAHGFFKPTGADGVRKIVRVAQCGDDVDIKLTGRFACDEGRHADESQRTERSKRQCENSSPLCLGDNG